MWHLFCHCLFLISPSFSASEGLCFIILAFPAYLHLFFSVSELRVVVSTANLLSNVYIFNAFC